LRQKKNKSKARDSMTKRDLQEDVVGGASKMVESEPTTAPYERKLKFIARLNGVISIFKSDSDFLDGLWGGFDPEESNPILNPEEIIQLVQITIKHFDFLPTDMKEYCLDNLSVFNIEKFNEQ
jgi:hypothetical protein